MFDYFDMGKTYSIVELQDILFVIKIDIDQMERTIKSCSNYSCTGCPTVKNIIGKLKIEKNAVYQYLITIINWKD